MTRRSKKRRSRKGKSRKGRSRGATSMRERAREDDVCVYDDVRPGAPARGSSQGQGQPANRERVLKCSKSSVVRIEM